MIDEKLNDMPEVFFEVDKGEYVQVEMSLPLQILFDNVLEFVSKTDV